MLGKPAGDGYAHCRNGAASAAAASPAGQDQEGIEGRDRRPEIAQAEHAAGDGEGEIAERLVQHDAAIFGPRLRQHRIVAGFRPVERAAVDDDAAHRIAVAADELGQRMDDDVGAVLDRPHQVGRGQRVVDDQRQAVRRAMLPISSMSTNSPPGLARLSMKMPRVPRVDLAFEAGDTSSMSAQRTSQPKFLKA